MEGFIPYNDLIKKPVVHGRREAVEALSMMNPAVGRPPITGHKPTQPVPQRFYVQLYDDDLFILVIPTTFKAILLDTRVIDKKPRRVRLKWTKWCDYSVQLQWMDDELVFFRGWNRYARRHGLQHGDTLVFKLENDGPKLLFEVLVFKFDTSTEVVFGGCSQSMVFKFPG
jgi:hypothetical protein